MNSTEKLFSAYDRELTFIRQLALDFKARYPRVAGRLALDAAAQSSDPHVERMIEAFALLSANVQVKLDDEFPELTDALFGVLYPHYLAPLPSMAILQASLLPGTAESPTGYVLPRHSYFRTAKTAEGVACRYRTAAPATLWPVEVAEAKLREPPYPPGLEPAAKYRNEIRSYLRLTIRCTGGMNLEQLALDKLRLFILGDAQLAVGTYEALLTELKQVTILPENRRLPPTVLEPKDCVFPVGFEPEDALLPYPRQAFAGYQLLSEFFAYPNRFSFFDLGGWAAARGNGLAGRSAEVVFYFNRPPRDGLVQGVTKGLFMPGCVPVVNLFEKTVEGFHLTHKKTEYPIEPDVHAPNGYEVYSVDDVNQLNPTTGEVTSYRPFYSFRHGAADSGPPFYIISRRMRVRQKLDGRPDIENSVGSDTYLRLIDLGLDPQQPADGTMTIRTTCLNRDLPKRLRESGEEIEFEPVSAVPVRVRCLRPPTVTLRPPLRKPAVWRLISHLNLNFLSLSDAEQGLQAVQEYLQLYDFTDGKNEQSSDAVSRQIVTGLIGLTSSRAVQFISDKAGGAYARGLAITADLDDEKFAGVGAYLFASVLERFLALYVSVNSFTQFTARSNRKDVEPWAWPPRAGDQVLL